MIAMSQLGCKKDRSLFHRRLSQSVQSGPDRMALHAVYRHHLLRHALSLPGHRVRSDQLSTGELDARCSYNYLQPV